jgi:hypothetical protein
MPALPRRVTEPSEEAFLKWKRLVNAEVQRRTGMDCDDLPDVDYWSMFEDDVRPATAAARVISNAQ